jgi:ATP-dependent RNA helicase RhlE
LSPALSARIPPQTEASSARATSFAGLGLLPELLKAVAEQGYTEPTPIQAQAIPLVLEGRDVMGAAQTGTGKTAGFTLPLLHRLARHANTSASPARHPVRALILTPTRELAAQIEESVRTYGKHLALRSTVVFGGVDMKPQTAALRQGVEFLVATPGRLLDHVQQKTVNLQQVEAFVLDEADRMLDMGFIPDVRRIMSLLPKRRQNLLFSATLTGEIRTLADSFLHDPVLVQVARNNAAADSVTHVVHPVRREHKRELLGYLIQSRALSQVLVFTSTRIGANRLAYQLNRDGIHAAAIHGDKSQPERLQALDDFKSGRVGVLVATDVAARGLDIEDLPYVVNFELPGAPEDYVHRIGRTGRAGATGEAISLVCPEEHERLEAIEKLARLSIPRKIVPGFEPDLRAASAIIGTASGRRGASPRERHSRNGERDRLTHARQEARSPDPIFSAPYEPSQATQLAPRQPPPQRPPRQVAALLGGVPKKG